MYDNLGEEALKVETHPSKKGFPLRASNLQRSINAWWLFSKVTIWNPSQCSIPKIHILCNHANRTANFPLTLDARAPSGCLCLSNHNVMPHATRKLSNDNTSLAN